MFEIREEKKNDYHTGKPSFCICPPKYAQPAKIDLNKKWLPKQKTIQNFNIDAQGFRKTINENPTTWEIGFTS